MWLLVSLSVGISTGASLQTDAKRNLWRIISNEASTALKEIDVSKGPRTNNIPLVFLKECFEVSLSAIFNKSLRDSTFPKQMEDHMNESDFQI